MSPAVLTPGTKASPALKKYPDWKVIVKNDDVNTFEHVIKCFTSILPNMTKERALELAQEIHITGSAVVWSGPFELAELYHQQLSSKGLTMAPLEN